MSTGELIKAYRLLSRNAPKGGGQCVAPVQRGLERPRGRDLGL